MVTWSFSSLASSLLVESSREDMMLLDSGRIDRMLDPSSPVIVDKQATRVRDRPKQQHPPPPRSDIYRK
eukprot:scaffold24807_cov76-Amphora_coffeaeformis.AAC.1